MGENQKFYRVFCVFWIYRDFGGFWGFFGIKQDFFRKEIQSFKNKVYVLDQCALNKVRWSKDGTKLVVGDAVGKIKIYNINKKVLIF